MLLLSLLLWADLGQERHFALKQEVTTAGISFSAGEAFDFDGVLAIPGLSIFMIDVRAQKCPAPQAETQDIEWTQPDPTHGRVGVALRPGCVLVLYVEGEDYFSESFFKEIPKAVP
jgi:hypothetical protein